VRISFDTLGAAGAGVAERASQERRGELLAALSAGHETVHVGASETRGMVQERWSLTYVSRGATEHQPTARSPA
jgi:hypothetical protein